MSLVTDRLIYERVAEELFGATLQDLAYACNPRKTPRSELVWTLIEREVQSVKRRLAVLSPPAARAR
jgi:hypothetical protein